MGQPNGWESPQTNSALASDVLCRPPVRIDTAEQTVLTVAICTRNRPHDLERCVISLVRAARSGAKDEILVVDDGVSEETLVSSLRKKAEDAGFYFVYHRKQQSNG